MKRNTDIDVFKHIDMHGGNTSKCWEWLGSVKQGRAVTDLRPYFTLNGRKQLAYRVVFNLFHPDEPLQPDELARHLCDNSICCNPTHIERGSHEDNMRDMRKHERHGLPHHAVRAIRKALANGLPQTAVACNFGVSRETISAIATKRVYKDVQDNAETQDDN